MSKSLGKLGRLKTVYDIKLCIIKIIIIIVITAYWHRYGTISMLLVIINHRSLFTVNVVVGFILFSFSLHIRNNHHSATLH